MKKKEKVILVIAGIIFWIMCFVLYYFQSINLDGRYSSDLSIHISMADKQDRASYSVFILLIQLLKSISNGSTLLIAFFLACVTVGTVWASKYFLETLFPQLQQKIYWMLAFASILVMPIHIPQINNWYIGLWVGNVWHNPTYLCMRFLGVIILIILYNIFAYDQGKISKKNWFYLAILLIIANAFKPNFVLCLVPALGFYLLYTLFEQKWKNIADIVCLVMAFVPCAIVLLIQYILMYGGTEEGGIAFSFAYFLTLRSSHPVIAIFQSMIFPIIVLLYNLWTKQIKKSYVFVWLMWGVGLGQYLFLIEEGPRKNHGNWTWGFYFCIYILVLYSIGLFGENCKYYLQMRKKSGLFKTYCIAVIIILGLCLLSGIIYFGRVLLGYHYY